MTRLADEVRPRWWASAVIVFDVIVPLLMTLAILFSPTGVLLKGETITEPPEANIIFQDSTRSQACGNLLGIAVAYLAATTKELKLLAITSQLLILYTGSLWLLMVLECTVQGYFDHMGFVMDSIMLTLQREYC